MIYRKFKIEEKLYQQLSSTDKKVLKILEEVVIEAGDLYKKQLRDGFYPEGITKEGIEKLARNNPDILSPFTYVKKNEGQFTAIPYHKLYANDLQPLAEKINIAAQISQNLPFKKYLLARAKSLVDGTYREADIVWFNVKNSTIDFSIGPFERYLDKIFFIKRAFQAHVGVINQPLTNLAEQYKEALYSSAKITGTSHHSTDIPQKGVHVYVEQTPAFSGYATDVIFSVEHFPCDFDLIKQYGSRILIYESQLKLKFDNLYNPIFKLIFEKKFASKYPKELLFEGASWCVLLYEVGKQLHTFKGARERLQELYGKIDEANAFASGIEHCKHLVVKGLISQDILEAIIITHILWLFADWVYYLHNPHKESHVIGNSMLFNSYLESGALKESGGISWPNFSRIFFQIELLASQLVYLLQKGTYNEAKRYIEKNAHLENFAKLGKNLKNLNSNF